MLFGVSQMKRLSCARVLLALPLFFIAHLSRLMLADIHTPKVTPCCAEALRLQRCEPPNSSDALFLVQEQRVRGDPIPAMTPPHHLAASHWGPWTRNMTASLKDWTWHMKSLIWVNTS